jgi:hypothetical protein
MTTLIERFNDVSTKANAAEYAATEEKFTFCVDLLEISLVDMGLAADAWVNKLEDTFDKLNEVYATVEAKIAATQAKIEAAPNTVEDGRKAAAELLALMDEGPEGYRKVTEELLARCKVANNVDELERLTATLATDLMYCDKEYVVTNTPTIQSPAGFAMTDRVFVKTEIAVNVDSLSEVPNRLLRRFGRELHAHKLDVADVEASKPV